MQTGWGGATRRVISPLTVAAQLRLCSAWERRSARMKHPSRCAIIIAAIIVAFLSVGAWMLYRIADLSIRASIGGKSAKFASAKIVKIMHSSREGPSDSSGRQVEYSICYIIDRLGEIESSQRVEYESAERRRLATNGARCWLTGSAAARNLRVGDALQVTYRLENNFELHIVGLEVCDELPGRESCVETDKAPSKGPTN